LTPSALTTILAALLLLGGLVLPASDLTPPQGGPDSSSREPAPPRLEIPQSEYHAGTLRRGEEATVVFTVRNGGEGELRLVRADSNCSCIRAVILRSTIPPGETGEVEVTFVSRTGTGEVTREVELTSNDPQHSPARLSFSARVEVPFGFEGQQLDLGRVHHRAASAVNRTAILLVAEETVAEPGEIRTSSPLISARPNGRGENREGHRRLKIEITVQPGFDPGPLEETITVFPAEGDLAPATLPVTGLITGDVETSPAAIRLRVVETGIRKARGDWKRIYISGHHPERLLEIHACRDSNTLLQLDLVELIPGELFELTATLGADTLERNSETAGTITIATNSPAQPQVTVDYSAVHHYYGQIDRIEETEPGGEGE